MATTLGVKVDEQLHERLKTMAALKDRSAHWIIRQAIEQYLIQERIGYVARKLEQFPELGQPMEDGARRQAFLHCGAGAYVIRYRRNNEGNVAIVRVWHCPEQRES